MELSRKQWIVLAVLVFLAAFSIRVTAIKLVPKEDTWVDVEIFRSSAALILRGINPYDYSDQVATRAALREQIHDPKLGDQAQWNYYAGSNLPLELLYFAGISSISDTPRFHRYSYAFFDSILAVLVAWFVIRHWRPTPGVFSTMLASYGMPLNTALFVERLVSGLALGCFSPTLLKFGGVFPEDKGTETLLILAAIACYLSRKDRVWYWAGAVFLGLSIAFKALGIFLVPMFAVRLLRSHDRRWSRFGVFASVAAIVAAAWVLPFWSGIPNMVRVRMLIASYSLPQHASMWVFPSIYFPHGWKFLRLGAVCVVAGVAVAGYWRKRISIELMCTALLVAFVAVWLINGGPDRQSIAIMSVILVLGTSSVNAALACMAPYLLVTGIGGFVTRFPTSEKLEGFGILLFVVVYVAVLARLSLASNDANWQTGETHSNT